MRPQNNLARHFSERVAILLGGPDYGPVYHSMPTMTPDVNSASEISQRYNVLVYSLYALGVGRAARSAWDLQIGLSGLTKLADETGGDCFSLGTSNLVSFKPSLERLQKMFDNQYYVVFQPIPGEKNWAPACQSHHRGVEFRDSRSGQRLGFLQANERVVRRRET
jgi:hypothetical protein